MSVLRKNLGDGQFVFECSNCGAWHENEKMFEHHGDWCRRSLDDGYLQRWQKYYKVQENKVGSTFIK